MTYLGIFLIYLALSVWAWKIASDKGRHGILFFIISLMLSPIIGLILAIVVSENIEAVESRRIRSGDMKKCPYCAEMIKTEAKICRYCQKELI